VVDVAAGKEIISSGYRDTHQKRLTQDALHKFSHALDRAIPGAVHPLRAKIIGAAIDLARRAIPNATAT
jgi:hypothetical protein